MDMGGRPVALVEREHELEALRAVRIRGHGVVLVAAAAGQAEARRILKRHLSDVIHRHMLRDLASQPPLKDTTPAPAPRATVEHEVLPLTWSFGSATAQETPR
jgi:hypothetical protein